MQSLPPSDNGKVRKLKKVEKIMIKSGIFDMKYFFPLRTVMLMFSFVVAVIFSTRCYDDPFFYLHLL